MERNSMRHRLVRLGGAGAMAIGLAAGGFGVASAATSGTGSSSGSATPGNQSAGTPRPGPGALGGHRGPGLPGGTITAVGASSFTLQRQDGTTQIVNTTPTTTYERDGQASSASALAVGEHVAVRPTAPPSSGSGAAASITAAAVDIKDPAIHGTVQSVNGDVLTVVDNQGFWRTVNLSAATTYTDDGQSATQSAVTPGARLVAFGGVDPDHTSLDATKVMVNPPRPTPPGPRPGSGTTGPGDSTGA